MALAPLPLEAGNPTQYNLFSTPYSGLEQWYCERGVVDGACNLNGVMTVPWTGAQFTTNQGFSVGITGLDPTGATDNSTILQNALTAVAGGGKIILPCGTFKLLSAVSFTATGAVAIEGAGYCTILSFQGGSTQGITLTYGNDNVVGFLFRDFKLVTNDATGAYTGLRIINHFASTAYGNEITQGNFIENVRFEGDNKTGAATHYWGIAEYNTGASSWTHINDSYTGPWASGAGGIGVKYEGYAAGVQYNTNDTWISCNFYVNATGFFFGDYLQGVVISSGSNFTGDGLGIDTVTSPAGFLAQLFISDTQVGSSLTAGIRINTASIVDVHIVNDDIAVGVANTEGLRLVGGAGRTVIANNSIFASTLTGTTGIHISGAGSFLIEGNEIGTGSGSGLNIGVLVDNVAASVQIRTGNQIQGNTTDYSINASIAGYTVYIDDDVDRQVANLPACGNNILGSRWHVVNQNTAAAYNGAVTGGGSINQRVECNGAAYVQR